MRHRTLVMIFLGTLATVSCSRSTRTVVLEPSTAPPPPPVDRPTSTAVTLGVPPGHLPDAGACRIWIPGTPPGRQPGAKSQACAGIAAGAPAGSWIIYRPTRDKKLVHVRVVDTRRPGVVSIVRIFDLDSGAHLRDLRPADEPQDEPEARRPDRGGEATMKLDIPRGHLPDVGECRVWLPAAPPGQQPKPKSRSCDGIANAAPAGSWVLYRPAGDARVVHVLVIDARRAGAVMRTRIFDIETHQLVREENP